MRSKKRSNNIIKETIKSVIISFTYIIIIFAIIFIFFSDTISEAISLISIISIEKSGNTSQNIKINLTTKYLEDYPEYGTKYGQIKISSLDIDLPLYYGDALSILKYGIGQSGGSYFPGEGGSIICTGHNTANMLNKLSNIKKRDKIIIETIYGTYTYTVYDTKIIKQTDIEALQIQRQEEILMIYTGYPADSAGDNTDRFIVYANLIEEQ